MKFGNVEIIFSPLSDAPIAIFLGLVAGLLGALFVDINARLSVLRKKIINTNLKKMIEVILFSFVTASLFFWISAIQQECRPITGTFEGYYRFTCQEGFYNPFATLFFNTESGTIRALMNQEIVVESK